MSIRPLQRSSRTVWLLAALILVCPNTVLFGHHAAAQNGVDCDVLTTIFSGFAFVGQAPCQKIEYRPHGMTALPTVKAFQPDVCYVFLFPNSSDQPVHELLERRLRKIGARITHSPSTSQDMVQLTMGGPLFHIEFQKSGQQGSIRTVQDPIISGDSALRKEWKSEDFVLLLRRLGRNPSEKDPR